MMNRSLTLRNAGITEGAKRCFRNSRSLEVVFSKSVHTLPTFSRAINRCPSDVFFFNVLSAI